MSDKKKSELQIIGALFLYQKKLSIKKDLLLLV